MEEDVVVVLGMHNSGTSVIAHLLCLLGGFVGEPAELLEPNPLYPSGYFERTDVVHMNNLLLASQNVTCFNEPQKWKVSAVPPIQQVMFDAMWLNLKNQISPKLKARKAVFVLKDPRLCLTLPKWMKHLIGTGNRVHVVIIYRDPFEVAESLFSKKKISRETSISLWELYNNALLANSSDLPRKAFAFWDVMENPRNTLRRLAALLGGGRYAEAAATVTDKQIAGAIDSALTHKRSDHVLTDSQRGLIARLKELE